MVSNIASKNISKLKELSEKICQYETQGRAANENISKLKELSDKICQYETQEKVEENRYKEIVNQIKNLLDTEKPINKDNNLNSYEEICFNIQIILNKFKIT